jgi:starvation-inducible DNA-binding protein
MYNTRNDLAETIRTKMAAHLNGRLADCIDLQTQAKQAHWNVKGPHFIALHKMFDELHEDVTEYVDTIAERVVQLGGVAHGTARMVAKATTLTDYPSHIVSGREHVEAVASALAHFGKDIRQSINFADELGDKDTADLFTGVSRGLDKWLWFVEAHLHAKD